MTRSYFPGATGLAVSFATASSPACVCLFQPGIFLQILVADAFCGPLRPLRVWKSPVLRLTAVTVREGRVRMMYCSMRRAIGGGIELLLVVEGEAGGDKAGAFGLHGRFIEFQGGIGFFPRSAHRRDLFRKRFSSWRRPCPQEQARSACVCRRHWPRDVHRLIESPCAPVAG